MGSESKSDVGGEFLVPGLDPRDFPRLAALASSDTTGAVADELRRFEAAASGRFTRRTRRERTLTVARLVTADSSAVVVIQDMSSSGVRLRMDRRHRPVVDGAAELIVNAGDRKVGLPIQFVRVASRSERDIDLAYTFENLDEEQQRLVAEVKGSGLSHEPRTPPREQ